MAYRVSHGRGRGGGTGGGGGRSSGGSRGGWRGRGRGAGQFPRDGRGKGKDCFDYKLLGECARQETGECQYLHRNKERTVHATVKIPNKAPMASALKGDFMRSLKKICEYRLKVSSENTVDIVVSQHNASHLDTLREKYEVLLSQLYPMGPGWCYVHRDGVEQCEKGSLLKFRPYKGRLPPSPGQISITSIPRELYITEEGADDDACQAVSVKNPPRQSETKEGLHSAIDRVHGDKEAPFNPKQNRRDVGVKIIKDHEEHMREMLKGALEWFCAEKRDKGPFVLKLEARFGKVMWRNIPEDVAESALGLTSFSHLCFSDTKHSRIFNTDVKKESVEQVKKMLSEEQISLLETFDIKFTIPGERERASVDVRLKFDGEEPTVLLVKKNEAKAVVFDVLCLHRDHDIRMTLNFYEVVRPEESPGLHRVVQHQLLRRVSYDKDKETLTLPPKSPEISVNFIRHKKREAYCIDEKLLLTITSIKEYKDPETELQLSSSSDPHTEIEFHNSSWECAFGRDVGLPPEQCLALHMENPAVSREVAGAIPHPWQPEYILDDFEDFWESLDSVNETLGLLH